MVVLEGRLAAVLDAQRRLLRVLPRVRQAGVVEVVAEDICILMRY